MIITIGSNKGGSGKTTLATNIAVQLATQKKEICLVDADFQRSAAIWQQDRLKAKLTPKITLIEIHDDISDSVKNLSAKFDHVIIDVAGRNSMEIITALAVSDVLIAPHKVSQFDLDTIKELYKQIIKIRALNPKLKPYILHSMANTNPMVKDTERKEFEEYLQDFNDFKILKSSCFYRKIYKDMAAQGKSVIESQNDFAKAEIKNIVKEILNDL